MDRAKTRLAGMQWAGGRAPMVVGGGGGVVDIFRLARILQVYFRANFPPRGPAPGPRINDGDPPRDRCSSGSRTHNETGWVRQNPRQAVLASDSRRMSVALIKPISGGFIEDLKDSIQAATRFGCEPGNRCAVARVH